MYKLKNENNEPELLTLEEKNSFLDYAIESFEDEARSKYICLEFFIWDLKNRSPSIDNIDVFPELYNVVKEEVLKSGSYFNGNGIFDMGVIRNEGNEYRKDLLIQLKKDINK